MRVFVLAFALFLALLRPGHAVDISLCDMVAKGQSEIVPLAAKLDDGRKVTLNGILTKPSGVGPFPVVLMLPGGGGLYPPYCNAAIVERFTRWGYATLIIASSTAKDISGQQLFEYSFVDQVNHARGARELLAEIGNFDLDRIAVWGFSRGGMAALELAASASVRADGFKAVIAAAPHCPSKVLRPNVPLLLVIGSNDRSVSVEICQEYATRLEGSDDFDFLLLPEAGHLFWQNPAAAKLSANRERTFLSDSLQ